jgi:hypothetical protein
LRCHSATDCLGVTEAFPCCAADGAVCARSGGEATNRNANTVHRLRIANTSLRYVAPHLATETILSNDRMEFPVPALSFRKPYASGGLASISDRASSPPVDTGEGRRGLRFESARAYHSFQYFREFSSESERNFTCNSSPVSGVLGTVGVGLVQLTPNTHPKIASPLLAVEFRLFRKIPTSGLPTNRPESSMRRIANHPGCTLREFVPMKDGNPGLTKQYKMYIHLL